MSETRKYEVVPPAQEPDTYRIGVEDWWNWVYDPNRDSNYHKGDLIFMRDNIVGPPNKPDDNIQEIYGKEGSHVFFPVYQSHICEWDDYPGGGKCDTVEKQREVADADMDKVQTKKATISIDGAEQIPITENLDDHDVTFIPFEVNVPEDNDLNREPGYHLPKGKHKGVARGTFILLKNFKEGTYVLEFEGISSDYETRSVYTLHITK